MRIVTLRTEPSRVVAVNGAVIAQASIAAEVQNQAGATPKESWDKAARALVVRELLLQRARTLGIAAEPHSENGLRETEDEALIRALLEREISTPTADEASCRRYYLAHQARLRSPDGAVLPFEQVHQRIAAYLEESAWRRAAAQYIALLAGQAEITGVDMQGATSPLVQ